MRVIDFNIHLPPAPNLDHERDITAFEALASLDRIGDRMRSAGVEAGNLMILDTEFLRREHRKLLSRARDQHLRCTAMIDPREPDAFELVDAGAAVGIAGIKFHPYMLALTDAEFPWALGVAARAAEKGMWIVVDCSYGTRRMYDVSGVRLAIALSEAIRTPIIAVHGGGKLVLDVMSLALDSPNVFLEISFSIPFWLGSSVETDFAFAIRKLGPERCLYGSDHPYVPLDDGIRITTDFLERHAFNTREIETVMMGTAERLFS